ncbi:nucleotidyltransferase domain-containing protein [Pyrobaculum aerophilum]|uniref:DNA polymerase subunit beta n=1 Tax=Pyrobaculum aerophilum TaxID=13773 RepID=A0A371R5P4_9CREN|nr:nucleotidyltransferase domain-containing protein [Pyrobaculum aerophilum]RFA96077.1 DNA polymerase subunit beta [Pyrobaculum aerophilum]RFA99394.1 DNA polymerase subunit beta [Pyrobaculum aerophilum]
MGKAKSALKSQTRALELARSAVNSAVSICRARGCKIAAAYLVGSRAREDYREDSDIDLVLIVEGVEGLNALQRLELFKEALQPNVELRVYTPSEWHSDSPWMRELRREALPLY